MFSFFKRFGRKKEEDIKKIDKTEEKEIKEDDKQINKTESKEEIKEFEEKNEYIKENDKKGVIKEEKTQKNEEEKSGFFTALEKTIQNITSIVPKKQEKIDFDTIEELLIESDMEYDIIEKALDGLPELITRKQLRHRLVMLFEHINPFTLDNLTHKPEVILVFGVNGAGKTTTIAKLANMFKQNKKSVILGAGDTFRAAAIEQLTLWSEKLQIPIVKTKQGHDPSAVAYDTIKSAIAKEIDVCLIDTSGRLQTQTNLNKELQKIVKVCNKALNGAPHFKILIIDGTQGNSAISQAKAFNEIVGIDAIIVTKLDGSAKGGAIFSIANRLELPIAYIGVGEKMQDLIPFDREKYVDNLLNAIFIK